MIRLSSLIAILSLALSAQAHAQSAEASGAALAEFLRTAAPVCETQPAAQCVDLGWAYADADSDTYLSEGELVSLEASVIDFVTQRSASLTPEERGSVALGLMMVQRLGLDRLIAGFDGNSDSRVDRQELLADVRLDQRPLGEVLLDPAAVDRQALAARLGELGPLVLAFFH
ncbi:MAG: hypothetical protein ACTS3R_07660 [Inquilinaceae bacterium]